MSRKIDLLVAHCSATKPAQDIGAEEIRAMHRKLGWFDIGYNFVIRRNGVIEDGRPIDKVPAHIGDCGPGMNARSIGVCMVGGVDSRGAPAANFTEAQFDSLRWHLKELARRYGISDDNIMGHNDVIRLARLGHWGKRVMAPAKACPSFVFRHWWETGEVVPFK
ncbi:N-acetylmuramoyl-L-alanine amidase [Inquilinus limosus]|uniref:N-acetylmuramoyl-L-alanine amidase n=1 Tax=Inquilinus limosus TaxID=171674 RepID=UPI00047B815F|nr:N-acetylmuramoyl-L-alanine amidase [Inquilinus limosus]